MTSPMTTSQDYLQRLRERRQSRFSANPTEAVAASPVPSEAAPEPESSTPYTPSEPEFTPVPQPAQQTPEYQEVYSSQSPEVTQTTQATPDQTSEPQPTPPTPDDDTDISSEATINWTAPSRPFKKRNARFYTTITVIVILISLILFFAGQFLPIAAVVAVAFLGYVLASVPPEQVRYQLSSEGVRIENNFYHWDEMGFFWLDKKYGQEFIQIEVPRFPFRLTLMLGDLPPDEMQKLFAQLLPEQHPALTYMDKIAHWVEKNILLDET